VITRPCETCRGHGRVSAWSYCGAGDGPEYACEDCAGTGTRQVPCTWCDDEATRLDPLGDPVCAAHEQTNVARGYSAEPSTKE
jgi:hypothetical protein